MIGIRMKIENWQSWIIDDNEYEYRDILHAIVEPLNIERASNIQIHWDRLGNQILMCDMSISATNDRKILNDLLNIGSLYWVKQSLYSCLREKAKDTPKTLGRYRLLPDGDERRQFEFADPKFFERVRGAIKESCRLVIKSRLSQLSNRKPPEPIQKNKVMNMSKQAISRFHKGGRA